jgi:hypothetical protein
LDLRSQETGNTTETSDGIYLDIENCCKFR